MDTTPTNLAINKFSEWLPDIINPIEQGIITLPQIRLNMMYPVLKHSGAMSLTSSSHILEWNAVVYGGGNWEQEPPSSNHGYSNCWDFFTCCLMSL